MAEKTAPGKARRTVPRSGLRGAQRITALRAVERFKSKMFYYARNKRSPRKFLG